MQKETEVPEGYMKNAKGGFDLLSMIKSIDIERDVMVNQIVGESLSMSKQIANLKVTMFEKVNRFVEHSFKKYNVKYGAKKGNMTFVSYDGEYKVQIAVNEQITFDERLQVAKQLVDECITEWASGADDKIITLVNDAFYVGKTGKVNTERILSLRRLNIKDKKWKKAMDAISDSIKVCDSRQYIRIYRRNKEKADYDLVNLDIASL